MNPRQEPLLTIHFLRDDDAGRTPLVRYWHHVPRRDDEVALDDRYWQVYNVLWLERAEWNDPDVIVNLREIRTP